MSGDNLDIFEIIDAETKRRGIPCVLVGGFALSAYRVSRQTFDIDLMLLRKDFAAVMGSLSKLGYRSIKENDSFAHIEANRFPLMDIDFLFVEAGTLERIRKAGKTAILAGKEFIVPSLIHLIALKLHAIKQNSERHEKDMGDIMALIKANHLDVGAANFSEMAKKYGSDQLYKEIISKIGEWKT